jgi:hypothetical protein
MHGTYHGTLFFMFLAIFRADFWYSGVFRCAEHDYKVISIIRDTIQHDTGYAKTFFLRFLSFLVLISFTLEFFDAMNTNITLIFTF